MSAIDAFTALAVAIAALYVARDSAGLAWVIVGGAAVALLGRGARDRDAARARLSQRFDPWLDRLPPPLGRYPRAGSTRRGWTTVAVTVPATLVFCMYLADSTWGGDAPSRIDVALAALLLVANGVVWVALRRAPREWWLYDDRVAVVHEDRPVEWWPLARIERLRSVGSAGPTAARIEWEDEVPRRLVIDEPACAAHLADLLEPATTLRIAQRFATSLRGGHTLAIEHGDRLRMFALGLAFGVAAWMGASLVGVGRLHSAADARRDLARAAPELRDGRWTGFDASNEDAERADREEAARRHRDAAVLMAMLVALIPGGGVVALAIEGRRARLGSRTLTRTGIHAPGRGRFLAWRDVRRVGTGATEIRLEGDRVAIEIDRRAWNAVLVPKIAATLASELDETAPDRARSDGEPSA